MIKPRWNSCWCTVYHYNICLGHAERAAALSQHRKEGEEDRRGGRLELRRWRDGELVLIPAHHCLFAIRIVFIFVLSSWSLFLKKICWFQFTLTVDIVDITVKGPMCTGTLLMWKSVFFKNGLISWSVSLTELGYF